MRTRMNTRRPRRAETAQRLFNGNQVLTLPERPRTEPSMTTGLFSGLRQARPPLAPLLCGPRGRDRFAARGSSAAVDAERACSSSKDHQQPSADGEVLEEVDQLHLLLLSRDCPEVVLLRPRQMLHSRSRRPRSISPAPTLNPGTTLRPAGGPSTEPRSAVPLRRVRNRAGS